jgi:hypothetical protein
MDKLRFDRPLIAALGRFIIVFAILVTPWPHLGRAFCDVVGAVATAVADPLTASSNVTFRLDALQEKESQPDWRAMISVQQDFPQGPVDHAGVIDLRRCGYLQLATFLALAAAWPPRGRRRALIAAAGALALVATAIALPVLAFVSSIGAVDFGLLAVPVTLASRALVAAPGMMYALPGLAWLGLNPELAMRLVPRSTRATRADARA